jgi:hypothetical protein
MLDAVALEGLRAAVIHVHRQRHRHGALWEHEPIAIVRIDLQIIGDDLELVAGHLEDFVVVNAHKKEKPEGRMPRREIQVLFALGRWRRQIVLTAGYSNGALSPFPGFASTERGGYSKEGAQ